MAHPLTLTLSPEAGERGLFRLTLRLGESWGEGAFPRVDAQSCYDFWYVPSFETFSQEVPLRRNRVRRVCVTNLPSLGNRLQKISRLWRWSQLYHEKARHPSQSLLDMPLRKLRERTHDLTYEIVHSVARSIEQALSASRSDLRLSRARAQAAGEFVRAIQFPIANTFSAATGRSSPRLPGPSSVQTEAASPPRVDCCTP